MAGQPRPEDAHTCPDPITQIVTLTELAQRLGIDPSTLRQHVHNRVPWLPPAARHIGRQPIWRLADVEDLKAQKPPRGRPRKANEDADSPDVSIDGAEHETPTPSPSRPEGTTGPVIDDGWWDDEPEPNQAPADTDDGWWDAPADDPTAP